jgi:hypothetical protein
MERHRCPSSLEHLVDGVAEHQQPWYGPHCPNEPTFGFFEFDVVDSTVGPSWSVVLGSPSVRRHG